MMTKTEETALLRFCELLRVWKESRATTDLTTALAALELAMVRGQRDLAEFMAHTASVVTGIPITVSDEWTESGTVH